MTIPMKRLSSALALSAVTVLTFSTVACSSGDVEAGESASKAASVEPTGNIIEITMVGVGEVYFGPDAVTAKRGDVLRFKLESGVHNVSFPADQNPAGVALPAASEFLQVPGQTFDLVVDMPAGEYTYHCDPHAALGMIGTLTVIE